MFDPEMDLNWTWKTIRDDTGVLTAMSLTEADNLTIAKSIIKTSRYDDLANDERRLCIFLLPSRPRLNNLRTPEMIQVDCHVPSREEMKAYAIIKAVHKALHGKLINGHVFEFAGQLGELITAPGYFCTGIRYKYHSTF